MSGYQRVKLYYYNTTLCLSQVRHIASSLENFGIFTFVALVLKTDNWWVNVNNRVTFDKKLGHGEYDHKV